MTSDQSDAASFEGKRKPPRQTLWGKLRGAGNGPTDRLLSEQLSTVVALLACLALLPSLVLCFWAANAFDTFAESHERNLLEQALAEEFEAVASGQQSVTLWDEAVIKSRENDQEWMNENAGIWMSRFYGHDRVFVLDPQDTPTQAIETARNVELGTFAAAKDAVLPVVGELRAELPGAEEPGLLTVQDLALIDGRPALVSVKPIVPSTDAVPFIPEETYIHVSVVYFDGALLRKLGARNLVKDARMLPPGAPAPVTNPIALRSAQGELLGYLGWTPSAPGKSVILTIAPGIAVSVMALLGVISWLLGRLHGAIAQIRESRAEVQHLAFHDTLTGLPNRALFDDRLDQALALVRRGEGRIALHYIDLDRFKYVNDTFGHPAGDELICQVAERLTAITRQSDTVARLGGDEFVILQTSARGWSSATRLAERTLDAIRQPFTLKSSKAFVGASIGIAVAPDTTTDRHELMRKADIALYQAKSDGKNRFYVFEDSFDEMARLKREVEEDLREALDGGEGLALVYQPFYTGDGKTIAGAEALFRWNHPRHGSLSPATLIAIAEERGLAADLGAWILREACRTAVEVNLPILSINISAQHFQDRHFPDMVLDLLSELGLPASRLQIEIKENMLLENGDQLGPTLDRLREAGVRIALDDFGSGYTSFRNLHRLRVDGIKIDRAFVQNMESDASTAAMVQVMFDLARAFEIEIVAGGVETESQWKRLMELGAPSLQGFLFSRPLPRETLSSLLNGPEWVPALATSNTA